jgi:hypothetical protein
VGVLSIEEEMLNNQKVTFARLGKIISKRVEEVRIHTESVTATRSPSQPRTKEEAMHPKDPYTSPGNAMRKTIMKIRGLIPWVGSRRSVCKTANENRAKNYSPRLLQSEASDKTEDQNFNPDGDCTNDLSPSVSLKIIGKEEDDILLDGPPKSDFVPPEFIFIETSDTWTSKMYQSELLH